MALSSDVLASLSADELSQIQQRQKDDAALPVYFSSALKTNVQISRDFEAFLILSSNDLKLSAIDWITKATKIQTQNKLRDDLTTLAINQELKNAQLKLDAYNIQLQGFNQFRQNFQTSNTFSSAVEVQAFLTDLQRVMPEISSGNDRAFFDQTIGVVLQRFQGITQLTSDQLEELRSWQAVLSAYTS